jgi:hypothetical protein
MPDVIVAGPGFVAVGYDSGDAAVRTSVDGRVWSRVPANVPGACNRVMRSVIVDGERLVAVGHGAASWTSVDGITWTLKPDDQATPGNDGQRMMSVTASDIDLVAVGLVGIDIGGENGDAAVWLQE